MAKRLAMACVAALLAVLGTACGGSGHPATPASDSSAMSTVPTADTPTPVVGPMDARTGEAAADELIRIVLTRDVAAWRAIALPMQYDCTTDSRVTASPPCGPDELDGTPVRALLEITAMGECRIAVPVVWIREDELASVLDLPALNPARSYRVYRSFGIPGTYDVVFIREAPELGYPLVAARLHLAGGRVTSLAIACKTDAVSIDAWLPPADTEVRIRPN